MACGPSILFGRAAGDGPRAPQVKEPRQRPWTPIHCEVHAGLKTTYGYTPAAASVVMVTHGEEILRRSLSGQGAEAITDTIYHHEFRCGRGRG